MKNNSKRELAKQKFNKELTEILKSRGYTKTEIICALEYEKFLFTQESLIESDNSNA